MMHVFSITAYLDAKEADKVTADLYKETAKTR